MSEFDAFRNVQTNDLRWTESNMLSSASGLPVKSAGHESGIFSNEHVIQFNHSPVNGQADTKPYNSFGSTGLISSADSGIKDCYQAKPSKESSHSSSSHQGDRSHSKEHKPSSSHHSSSSNGEKSHSKDPKLHSSSSSGKDGDKHRSSSSSHRDHSKSSDHRHSSSSSHSKSHSSSANSGDKAHSGSGSHSSAAKSESGAAIHGGENNKPRDDSAKSKHGSSSSHHSSSHKSSSSDSKDKHHSKSSHDSSSKHRDPHSSSKSHHEASSRDSNKSSGKDSGFKSPSSATTVSSPNQNNSVKLDASSLKVKIEAPNNSSLATRDIKDKPISQTAMMSPSKIKVETVAAPSDDDDEMPLSMRIKTEVKPDPSSAHTSSANKQKRKRMESDDEDSDTPLSVRKNKKLKQETEVKIRKREDDDFKPKKAKISKQELPTGKTGKKAKVEEEETSWKWWEEEPKEEGVKWKSLEHKGPIFAPLYEPLPDNIHFYYDGKKMRLSEQTEEIAGFYARMLDHDYTTKDLFNNNFFKDWRKFMTKEERSIITDLKRCNFREIYEYYKMKSEERKNMSKEEKLALKKENEALQKEYGFCIIDGHKQKIGNFRIEPPGLFRGRGDHPKQGMLKTRVQPEDIIINCSKGSKVPTPPAGHKWKEVRHDNTVTWLASWTENVQGQTKYIMLNAASKLKGEKDYNKYETARKLHKRINQIRNTYREDWKSKEMRVRQRAVALYFIDKLALRAGNEKDEDQADTVGCCSLRVEHIKLHEQLDDKQYVVEFDFLGKDSIRYFNQVPVDKRVFKNLQLFMENKQDGDDLFDRLNTGILNKHLQTLMDGLTAKVFRTYNASHTLQEQLDLMSQGEDFAGFPVAAKMLTYNRANRAVAILCNHQRAVSKNFGKQMENLQAKIDAKKDIVKAAKKELKDAKSELKHSRSETVKNLVAKKQRAYDRAKEQLTKLEVQATDKDENKEIALGTSKLNYLDPRISIAWCKKWDVPIEKVYNKTQREKFAWAIDMTDEDFQF